MSRRTLSHQKISFPKYQAKTILHHAVWHVVRFAWHCHEISYHYTNMTCTYFELWHTWIVTCTYFGALTSILIASEKSYDNDKNKSERWYDINRWKMFNWKEQKGIEWGFFKFNWKEQKRLQESYISVSLETEFLLRYRKLCTLCTHSNFVVDTN
jgi:hypothetical protein